MNTQLRRPTRPPGTTRMAATPRPHWSRVSSTTCTPGSHASKALACPVGREAPSEQLLPVSKTVAAEAIRLSYAEGCRMLGENKVEEALRKWETLADLTNLRWSMVAT